MNLNIDLTNGTCNEIGDEGEIFPLVSDGYAYIVLIDMEIRPEPPYSPDNRSIRVYA